MKDSARILGPSSGPLDAALMFVGEAPGRLGADGSGIPFHGDKAGDNFEDLLESVGISRSEIFVTNAVLCNPKNEDGHNAAPSREEIENCAGFLREQIQLVNPRIVAPLGATALKALARVEEHKLTLREHVRTAHNWNGRTLIPLYHPGQRAMIHRSAANQRSDYQFVLEQLRRCGRSSVVSGKTNTTVANLVRVLLEEAGGLSYFAVHKILYLVEYRYAKERGIPLSRAHFVRQKDGPYCTDVQIRRLRRALPDMEVRRAGRELTLRLNWGDLFETKDVSTDLGVGTENELWVRREMRELAQLSNAELKRRAYLTRPMREVLSQERMENRSQYNSPIRLVGQHAVGESE